MLCECVLQRRHGDDGCEMARFRDLRTGDLVSWAMVRRTRQGNVSSLPHG